MKIITSWDDAANHDMRLADLLEKYNLPGIFYVPAYWESFATIKGWHPITKPDLISLSERFEIGSHGITHALLTRVPQPVMEYEVMESKNILEQIIQKEVTSFCYPRGYANETVKAITKRIYKTARNTLVGTIEEPEDPIWTSTAAHVGCNRTEYDGLHWYDYAIKMLNKAKTKKNSVYHIFGHSWELDHNDAWEALERLFAEMSQAAGAQS